MSVAVRAGLLLVGIVLLVFGVLIPRSRRALWGWRRRRREMRQRVLAEDALKQLHHWELGGRPTTAGALRDALRLATGATASLIARMEAQGWLRSSAGDLSLTAEGARLALEVIRAHRLWERYLVDEARMPLADVHAEAERREHDRSPEALDALEAAMGHPTTDPHGAPIPTRSGDLARLSARAVTQWPIKTPARIVHLEDEPPAVFAQIAAEGFRPGQMIRVIERDARRIVLSDGEETHILAPIVAANIFVAEVEKPQRRRPGARLTSLKPGQRATVCELDDALQGFTRRRLLDLGLTPGVTITAEMTGIFRDPVAYRVRGSLVALRHDQARHVVIQTGDERRARDG